MKNYVSANAKYYKNSNASGAFGHILRTFLENKNVFPEYTKNNFSSPDIMKKYQELYSNHQSNLKKKMTGKENTFLDIVVAFSLDTFEELEKNLSKEELEEKLKLSMNSFLNTLKMNYGFEPVGFAFHLDEGHICPETGILKRNIHAHAIVYNYDFKNKVAPLRKMKKEHFSEWQDLAGHSFAPLGFQRGVSKEETLKNHLEKDIYVAEKHKVLEQEIEKLKTTVKRGNLKVEELKKIVKKGKEATEKVRNDFENEKKKFLSFKEKMSIISMATPRLFGAIFSLNTPDVIKWSRVIADAIPNKKSKEEIEQSLNDLIVYSDGYAKEVIDLVELSKSEIVDEYEHIQEQKRQDQRKKKSPGLSR